MNDTCITITNFLKNDEKIKENFKDSIFFSKQINNQKLPLISINIDNINNNFFNFKKVILEIDFIINIFFVENCVKENLKHYLEILEHIYIIMRKKSFGKTILKDIQHQNTKLFHTDNIVRITSVYKLII